MLRLIAAFVLAAATAAPAFAQSAEEVGQMRLYIQQLEERLRQLTGENERLAHEVNQLRGQLGQPVPGPVATGAVPPGQPMQDQAGFSQPPPGPGAPPQDLGTLAATQGDQWGVPVGPGQQPVDLSTLAAGAPELAGPGMAPDGTQTAAIPSGPSATTALSGSPRDEYDLAYGFVLTGDYGLAEESFKAWLASFPNDPQAADAQFWLGESHLQQGEYQEAANAFLAVYKAAPESPKAPDALLKLGTSLSALGETSAACATLAEVGRKYPQAPETLMSRVKAEEGRAGC